MWVVKKLSRDQEAQHTFRAHLDALFSDARMGGRQPAADEIKDTVGKREARHIDAFVEECVRVACPMNMVARDAIVDTTILGHPIPKGTTVVLATRKAGYTTPGYAHTIDESVRSESSRKRRDMFGEWEPADVEDFKPERWLKNKADGEGEIFDPNAGPVLTFGTGIRGCFGRRLAYLELRIVLVLLFWNYQFLPISEDINGDDFVLGLANSPTQCYVRLQKFA